MTFGETLRGSRKKMGGSLRDYAHDVGSTAGQLSRIERDLTGSVNAVLLRRLSDRYELPTETLLDLLDARRAHAEQ